MNSTDIIQAGKRLQDRFEQLATDPRLGSEHHAFTFGHGQEHFNRYVVIAGTSQKAFEEINQRFGMKWSMQYPYDLAFLLTVCRWNWKELV